MYFKNQYVKYICILIFAFCTSLITLAGLYSPNGIHLKEIVIASNFYTLGTTGAYIKTVIHLIL